MIRIGSLCTGYGGLDEAVRQVLGGTLAWVADSDPGASAILAHHWPDVPNLGDITKVDWAEVVRVNIVAAGFPCTDVSCAGARAGLREGTRTGVWYHVAECIAALRPQLVVLENVGGLLSASADSDVEPCPWCLGDPGDQPHMRALGAVLADLASLGFDAQWASVRASDVGAPHRRERVFIIAWPADAESPRLEGAWLRGRPSGGGGVAADADRFGGERHRPSGQPAQRHLASSGGLAADAAGVSQREPADEADAVAGGGQARPEPRGGGVLTTADAEGDGRDEGRTEPAGIVGGPDAALGSGSALADPQSDQGRIFNRDGCAPADTDRGGLEGNPERDLSEGAGLEAPCGDNPDGRVLDWGQYGPAIRRWERITGRSAPSPRLPTGRGGSDQLNPVFVEWMMGLPAGHVTAVPDLTRNQMLKALGNGVVPDQAAHALRLLLPSLFAEVAA